MARNTQLCGRTVSPDAPGQLKAAEAALDESPNYDALTREIPNKSQSIAGALWLWAAGHMGWEAGDTEAWQEALKAAGLEPLETRLLVKAIEAADELGRDEK